MPWCCQCFCRYAANLGRAMKPRDAKQVAQDGRSTSPQNESIPKMKAYCTRPNETIAQITHPLLLWHRRRALPNAHRSACCRCRRQCGHRSVLLLLLGMDTGCRRRVAGAGAWRQAASRSCHRYCRLPLGGTMSKPSRRLLPRRLHCTEPARRDIQEKGT